MGIPLRPSAKAVVVRDGRLPVARKVAEQDAAGEWLLLPGGGQRRGETLPDAVIGEVSERRDHRAGLPGRRELRAAGGLAFHRSGMSVDARRLR